MARFWPKSRYNGRVMAREVFFYHWLWVNKFCATFGCSRTPRKANAHKSFIVLRCMWKEPAPFTLYCFLFLDLGTKSTSRSTLTITALLSPSWEQRTRWEQPDFQRSWQSCGRWSATGRSWARMWPGWLSRCTPSRSRWSTFTEVRPCQIPRLWYQSEEKPVNINLDLLTFLFAINSGLAEVVSDQVWA